MKLVFSTLPCMDYSAKQLAELCKKYNFCGAEVRTNNDNSFTHGDGLTITDIGSSICIKDYNEAQLESAKKLLSDIEACGIKAMRVFLGNFCVRYSDSRSPISHDGIVKMLQEMCRSTSCEVWVETHNEYATGKALHKLAEDVNCDNLKFIWDIVHPIEDGEAPEDTMKFMGDRLAHIHIKDGHKRSDPDWHDYEYTPLGEGTLPIAEIVKLLVNNGYDGYFSLEWENPWRPELKNLGWSVDKIMTSYIEFMKNI